MARVRGGKVGLVIAGAGARGAYEMSVLSVIVPWLRSRGDSPRIVVGTSAGAINAVLVSALCHLPDPHDAADQALAVWRDVSRHTVFRSLLVTGPWLAARYAAGVAGIRHAGVTSLLDPDPLRRTLERFEHWPDLHANVRSGALDAVAVIATAATRARTDVFVEAASTVRLPRDDTDRRIGYRRAHLGPEHVMASSAIPVAFPPVLIGSELGEDDESDDAAEGNWYLDGGVRLNAPIKPALALGARRLVVVATHPLTEPVEAPRGDARPPDLFAAAAQVLTGTLVDRMVEDVRSLDRVNHLVAAGASTPRYRAVPYLFVGPPTSDTIAKLADQVLRTKYDGPKALLSPDFAILNRLVGGPSDAHGDLLSYLLFDHDFVEALIEQGRSDALAALDRDGGSPWQLTRAR